MNPSKLLISHGLLISGKVNVNAQRMLKNKPILLDELKKLIPHAVTLKQLIHDAARDIKEVPACVCGNLKKFETRGSGKYVCCSKACGVVLRITAQGNSGLEENARKRHTTLSKIGHDGLTGFQRMEMKRMQTNIDQGRFIHPSRLHEAQKYRSACWKITYAQPLHTLKNFHLRGRAGVPNAHHIDHIVSINFGFINGIDPKIIGNIKNLRMLPYKDNLSKGMKCDMSLEELLKIVEC